MSEYKYPKSVNVKMKEERNALEVEFKKDGASDEDITLLRVCFDAGFLIALSTVKSEGLLK